MGRNLFLSLAIKDNLKVAFLEKNSTNPNKYLVTITVWALAQLFCLMLITRSKSVYMTNFPFLHSAYQECMNFAKIGDGPCYYH